MRFYWFFVISLFILIEINGQHCPFDNTGLIVLEVLDARTNKKLKDVTPFIIVSKQAVKEYNFNSDTLKFVLNPKQTSKQWYVGFRFNEVKYDFAQDNYILTLPMDDEFMTDQLYFYVKTENGGIIRTKYYLKENNFFDLHDNFGNVWGEFENMKSPQPRTVFNQLISITINN